MPQKQKNNLQTEVLPDAIAIVGMGCRFPGGVTNPAAYWNLLQNGVDAIVEVPPDRWSNRHFYHPDREQPGKIVTRSGGFLDDVARFDPQFFGISPHEAEQMDPQQRLLLEVTWEALEDGAQNPGSLAGTDVGVFIGAFTFDYHALQFSDPFQRHVSSYSALSSMATMIANRISYIYDFRGPSITLDTACSSSLVAVHLAAESLRRGESDMALAGGVTLLFTPQYSIIESKGGFLSPDGRCKTFDAAANGYVRGEGVGIVVLKRLQDALKDGDPVQAIILASGSNQDGHTVGITVPNPDAQEKLIAETVQKAGISPLQVQYVEAHGTGTAVGDPIETRALGRVYGRGRACDQPLFIGSCKTNIGHTEAAAGIAGLIKTVLCLQHKQIPPNLHFQTPNPNIHFAEWKLRVPTRLESWPQHQGAALAAVNSFGYGGTNAHVILQQAPSQVRNEWMIQDGWTKPFLLPLSARSAKALPGLCDAYKQILTARCDPSQEFLFDLCWSAGAKREHHAYRQAFVCRNRDELVDLIDQASLSPEIPGVFIGKKASGEIPKLVWIFSGMGPQWWGMGRQLLEREPVFRAALEQCDRLHVKIAGWSILQELCKDEATSQIHQAYIAMTANFALQVALVELWRYWGIVPDAIVGHSAGEVAAFYAAGVYTLEDALTVIFHRSRLAHRLSGCGRMAAVGLPEAVVMGLLREVQNKVEIAAVNSPMSITLTGDAEVLEELVCRMQEKKYFCKLLHGEVPYHSRYMEEIKGELLESIRPIRARKAMYPLYSTVTGEMLHGEEVGVEYWWRNVREKVQFGSVIRRLADEGYRDFLEIGPHPVLAGAVVECLMDKRGHVVSSLNRKKDESLAMLESLARLYTSGFEPDWQALYPDGQWVPLPTYSWQNEIYWSEEEPCRHIRLGYEDHPLLGRPQPGALSIWEGEVSLIRFPFVRDHRVLERIVFPAACYIESTLGALHMKLGLESFAIEEFEIRKGLHLTEATMALTQYYLDQEQGQFKIYAKEAITGNDYSLHASGYVRSIPTANFLRKMELAELHHRCPVEIDRDAAYKMLQVMGFSYGPSFQGMQKVFLGQDEALAEVASPFGEGESEYWFPPVLMDACFQTLLAAEFPVHGEYVWEEGQEFRIPVKIGQIRVYQKPMGQLWAYGRMTYKDETITRGDLKVFNAEGYLVAEFLDFVKQAVDMGNSQMDQTHLAEWFYEINWQKQAMVSTEDQSADGTWLILADQAGVAEEVAMRLQAMGGDCVLVNPGDEYAFSSVNRVCTIEPDHPEHYQRLWQDLSKVNASTSIGVIHCWNLSVPSFQDMLKPDGSEQRWQQVKTLGCHSLLFLLQSVIQLDSSAKIWLVTRGAEHVGDEPEPLEIFQSAALGLGRVIGQQEWQQNWGGAIDLDSDATPEEAAQALIGEVLGKTDEDEVVFRGSSRYVPRLRKATGLTGSLPPRFRADSAYLITGAFGALGQEVARRLVKRGARWLIFMSRSGLPERSLWGSAELDAAVAARIAFVRELEAKGTHILTVGIDLSDAQAVAAFFREYAITGWPPLRGVIHSAGVLRDLLLARMDGATFDEVYDPKAKGAWVLHQTLLDQPLEFFILFSSVASIMPSAGQGNYAAANAFLDALAAHRKALGLPALSINWGPWTTGMVKQQNLIEHYRSLGMECITPGVGGHLLEHLMAQNVSQMIALSADWRVLSKQFPRDLSLLSLLRAEMRQENDHCNAGEQWLDEMKQRDPAERKAVITERLVALICEVLHYEQSALETDKSLPEIGLDSMMALKLRTSFLNELGVVFMVSELLSGISIEAHAENAVRQFEKSMGV